MNYRVAVSALSLSVLLAACGGGGGDGDAPAASQADVGAGQVSTGDQSSGGNAGPSLHRASACPNFSYTAPQTSGRRSLPPGASVWLTEATTKVRPTGAVGSTQLTEIEAARNEYEMFQVVVGNNSDAIRITDVHFDLPTLPKAGLGDLDRVMIYRAGYMDVTSTSNSDGATGLWPDAMIPKVDSYACETRNAFPVDVAPGRNQAFYVEVYTPLGTSPGNYSGTMTITGTSSAGEFAHTQNVNLKVWNFTLPSTASLQSSFGFVGGNLGQGHDASFARSDLRRLSNRYALGGLRHRIGITSGLAAAPPFTYSNGTVNIDWTETDEDIGPFLNGTAHHNGAKWAAVDIRPFSPSIYNTNGATGLTAYYRAWAQHFTDKGWFEKLWGYTRDEPSTSEFAEVKDRASAMLAANPSMRPLVTKNLADGLRDTPETSPIRIWTPLLNQMNASVRAQFDPYIQQGAELWWYQSCESHGCFGNDVTGYPSYMIDAPGTYARAQEWLSFVYGITGELYFNTMEAYYKVSDPWNSVYLFTGNGDGTLFYPGRPNKIGGATHIPVESLRLKLIREGFEDYEYLKLLSGSTADRDFLSQQVGTVARSPRDFARDAGTFYNARRQIGERIAVRVSEGVLEDKSSGQ